MQKDCAEGKLDCSGPLKIIVIDATDPRNPQLVTTYAFDPVLRVGQVVAIGRDTQGDRVKGLMKDDLLVSVGGVDTRGKTLREIGATIKASRRPVEFVFQRHTAWVRNKNGLPTLDRDMLKSIFKHHDSDGGMSLDAVWCVYIYLYLVYRYGCSIRYSVQCTYHNT